MRGRWLLMITLAGCGGQDHGTGGGPGDEPHPDAAEEVMPHVPGACAYQVALYGMTGNSQATPVGPMTVDEAGIDVCVSLDARDNIQVAHFAAGTQYETAASSSFALALYMRDGTLLQQGWDVAFGSSPTTSFANLEYGVTKGVVLDAVLWVRAKAGTATSAVDVALFEPFE